MLFTLLRILSNMTWKKIYEYTPWTRRVNLPVDVSKSPSISIANLWKNSTSLGFLTLPWCQDGCKCWTSSYWCPLKPASPLQGVKSSSLTFFPLYTINFRNQTFTHYIVHFIAVQSTHFDTWLRRCPRQYAHHLFIPEYPSHEWSACAVLTSLSGKKSLFCLYNFPSYTSHMLSSRGRVSLWFKASTKKWSAVCVCGRGKGGNTIKVSSGPWCRQIESLKPLN